MLYGEKIRQGVEPLICLSYHHVLPSGGHWFFFSISFFLFVEGITSLFYLYVGISCKMPYDDSCLVQMCVTWILQSVLLGKPVQNSSFHMQENVLASFFFFFFVPWLNSFVFIPATAFWGFSERSHFVSQMKDLFSDFWCVICDLWILFCFWLKI